MTPLTIGSAAAAEHTRDLRREACASRLAALARCCAPSAWGRALEGTVAATSRLRAAVRRSQLGPSNNYCACS